MWNVCQNSKLNFAPTECCHCENMMIWTSFRIWPGLEALDRSLSRSLSLRINLTHNASKCIHMYIYVHIKCIYIYMYIIIYIYIVYVCVCARASLSVWWLVTTDDALFNMLGGELPPPQGTLWRSENWTSLLEPESVRTQSNTANPVGSKECHNKSNTRNCRQSLLLNPKTLAGWVQSTSCCVHSNASTMNIFLPCKTATSCCTTFKFAFGPHLFSKLPNPARAGNNKARARNIPKSLRSTPGEPKDLMI